MAKRSSAWEGRNARAQAAGFRNYYDYRAHDYGRSEGKLAGDALRQARGHASAADLESTLASGRVVVLSQEPVGDRLPDGRYREVRVTAQMVDGSQRRFRLRGKQLTEPELRPLRAAIQDSGTDVYNNPSLDVLAIFDPLDELDREAAEFDDDEGDDE